MMTQEEIDRKSEAHAVAARAYAEKHRISVGYAIGIFLLPIFFVWRLLGSGYKPVDRVIWFGWFALWLWAVLSPVLSVRLL